MQVLVIFLQTPWKVQEAISTIFLSCDFHGWCCFLSNVEALEGHLHCIISLNVQVTRFKILESQLDVRKCIICAHSY
jgi:hypothetical protein